jgi:hypothetical protein
MPTTPLGSLLVSPAKHLLHAWPRLGDAGILVLVGSVLLLLRAAAVRRRREIVSKEEVLCEHEACGRRYPRLRMKLVRHQGRSLTFCPRHDLVAVSGNTR